MNELINWVALNNTLMIRIGFSAVLLLVIIYVFRYFFIPRISFVTQAEEAAAADEAQTAKEQKPAVETLAAEEQARTEEIEVLKAEVESLKAQIQELPAAAVSAVAATIATTAAPAPFSVAGTTAPPVKEDELVTKIQSLEARLSEYEIIAEEIAEISILREENAELKARLAGALIPEAIEPEAVAEPMAETELLEPITTNYDADEKNPPVEAESQLVITSEVEVSQDEQALINDFEEMIRKKG